MKINNVNFNFNRMLKVELINPGARDNKSVACTIEYCPYKDEYLCPRLDVTVTDLPSADGNDLPGYTADVKIYNPNREILNLIAQNSEWLITERDTAKYSNASEEKKELITTNNLQDYYRKRLQMRISAGYWATDTKDANYTIIFNGYVNGSSLTHKGTDDILTIGAHDINVDRMDVNAVTAAVTQAVGIEHEEKWKIKNRDWYRGAKTWDLTFKKYVRFFEQEKLVNGKVVPTEVADNGSNDWFRVVYVKSVKAYLNARSAKFASGDYINNGLKASLATSTNPFEEGAYGVMTSFYTDGRSLPAMLDQLCAVDGLRLGWKRFILGEEKLTYIVYELSDEIKFGPIEKGDIVIYNYQNLLATPSVNGAGCLDIKMMFNPECMPWKRIALQLDEALGKTHGVADVSSFETHISVGGHMLGVMDSSAGMNNTVAMNQLTGSQAVAAQRKVEENGKADGYMFNTGFPITKVVHRLTTHESAWTTQVATVPMVRGIDMENKNG